MSGDGTKERILEISLNLFSKHGFHAVSIRDICREVKIKESSLYYHFANKRAVLNELHLRFEDKAESMMNQLDAAVAMPGEGKEFSGEAVSHIFFEKYLMDDFCNRFLRLLSMEQNHDDEIRKVYDRWFFEEPLRFQSKIFAALLQVDQEHSEESDAWAVKYYAPVFLYTQRYLLTGELTEDRKEDFRKEVYSHINRFFMEMGGK